MGSLDTVSVAHSPGSSAHANDTRVGANAADDLCEMAAIADIQPERQRRRIAVRLDCNVVDITLCSRDAPRNLREQADAVHRPDMDLGLELALDNLQLLDLAKPAIERGESVQIELPIINTNWTEM